ncbi:TetR/AcrR family transcriptional regulator [Cellulomonas sp. P24]|uniref:TetR/AcrR family transcriptional regulator n=1 Tax=Cellulomonas sp. P24 TaxID=2885206 RepID=UPI00216ACFFF|nr:TetR/AcrR family transcriptional regulator [Cellulomonas sp. P24]MCR6493624.1 TetR/AcrR family transcriptional regulator [Cellulomonas sp. P24]
MNRQKTDAPPAAAPPLWERVAQAHATQRPTLTHGTIADAALRIADADGIASVSMRRLADELGVSAMACYRYVSGKDEVLELMLDTVRKGVLLENPRGDWRSVLRASAMRFHSVILRHPWITDLPGRILFATTPALLAVAEQNLTALDGLGLTTDQMAAIAAAVTAYTRASAHDEVTRSRLRSPEGWASEDDAKDANAARLDWLLATGDYPTYGRYVHSSAPPEDDTARFEFGLDCLLDGIATRIGKATAGS